MGKIGVFTIVLLSALLFIAACQTSSLSEDEAEIFGGSPFAGKAVLIKGSCQQKSSDTITSCKQEEGGITIVSTDKSTKFLPDRCLDKGTQRDFSCLPDGGVQYCDYACEGNEVCDDKTAACTPPECGDGVVEGDEQCDDTNDNPFDGCHFCQLTSELNPPCSCGNSFLENASVTECQDRVVCPDGQQPDWCFLISDWVGESYQWPEECDYRDWRNPLPEGYGCTEQCRFCAAAGTTPEAGRECCTGLTLNSRGVCVDPTMCQPEDCPYGCNPETNDCCQVVEEQNRCEGNNTFIESVRLDCSEELVETSRVVCPSGDGGEVCFAEGPSLEGCIPCGRAICEAADGSRAARESCLEGEREVGVIDGPSCVPEGVIFPGESPVFCSNVTRAIYEIGGSLHTVRCPYGCTDGACLPPVASCTVGQFCFNSTHRAYREAGCTVREDIMGSQGCPFGCSEGECLPPAESRGGPRGCGGGSEVFCIDNHTRGRLSQDCSSNTAPCQFTCSDGQCLPPEVGNCIDGSFCDGNFWGWQNSFLCTISYVPERCIFGCGFDEEGGASCLFQNGTPDRCEWGSSQYVCNPENPYELLYCSSQRILCPYGCADGICQPPEGSADCVYGEYICLTPQVEGRWGYGESCQVHPTSLTYCHNGCNPATSRCFTAEEMLLPVR